MKPFNILVGTLISKATVFVTRKPIYPLLMTGLWSRGIIGPYFFENEDAATITVYKGTHRSTTTNFVYPLFLGVVVKDVWFQQDKAICITSYATIDFLRQKFDG